MAPTTSNTTSTSTNSKTTSTNSKTTSTNSKTTSTNTKAISTTSKATTASSKTTPRLSSTNLTRVFDTITALDGINIELAGPQIIGIAGPNGSGKTTLIRSLLGLLQPTEGEAAIDGTPTTALTAADRRRIGYMPQERAIYDDLTVRENVGFFGSLYGVTDGAAVDRVLSFVDLLDRQHSRIGNLSGGMVRRTSLACALVHDPDILFLDEPTVGLDPELRASMWDGFRTRRDDGALVVVSTHYLGEVSRCDRILFLRDGAVLALDSPEVLRERTGTADVEAAFLALLDDEDGVNATSIDATGEKDDRSTRAATHQSAGTNR